jgi:uncharacterized protein DUF2630
MTFYAQALLTPHQVKDFSPVPPELHLSTRIENLVGEEARLLEEPPESRGPEHRERLRLIAAELDRIWEKLRERAGRHGGEHASANTGP